jgi:site-specific recombinase XerD
MMSRARKQSSTYEQANSKSKSSKCIVLVGTSEAGRKHIRNMDGLGATRREQYATLLLLAAASGLRSSELLALKIDDIDFKASTVRVDESPADER